LLQEALTLIEPGREPRLDLSIRHNLANALTEAGRALEARRIFHESRSLYLPEPWLENRRRWLSARIHHGPGPPAEAAAAFLAAREGFLGEGTSPYDIALVTLDLAALYAESGRMAELRSLAAETEPIFRSRRIHREALVALSFFLQTIETAAVTTE